jgi:hypothetical protein
MLIELNNFNIFVFVETWLFDENNLVSKKTRKQSFLKGTEQNPACHR